MISIGETPLAYVVRGGTVETVRFLLDHGADPNQPGEHGCTVLHVAAGAGSSLLHVYVLFLFYFTLCAHAITFASIISHCIIVVGCR